MLSVGDQARYQLAYGRAGSDQLVRLDGGRIEPIVYGALADFRGSVSAEHGIGLEKKPYLSVSRSEPELALMRTLKQALDPKNLLNPGKIL